MKYCLVALILLGGTSFGVASKDESSPHQEEYYTVVKSKDLSKASLEKADALRVRTIGSINSLLNKKSIKGSKRFELLLRLGTLYAERHDYARDIEWQAYENAYKSWNENGKKGREPKVSHAKSRSFMAKAANSFRTLVKEFPKHPRSAAALYALGKTLARLGDQNSVLYFNQLIKNHKRSPLVPDTYLSLGEFYFDKHDMSRALANYKQVMRYKKHGAYPYAVYKSGWAHFNNKASSDKGQDSNYAKAISSFKLVIMLADRDKRMGKAGRIDLREEAVKDLVMTWSKTRDIDAAWAYFKTIDEKSSFYDLLEVLGNQYADQGSNKSAIRVFSRLVNEAPLRERNPEIYKTLVKLYDAEGDRKSVVERLEAMAEVASDKSPWVRKYANDKLLVNQAKKDVEFQVRRYATLYHQRGQKTKSKALLATSRRLYALYLSNFPEDSNAYEMRYYYASVLFDFDEYLASSDQYVKVAKQKPKSGKYLKEAAYNSVLAIKKLDGVTKYAKLPPAGQVPEPMAIPATRKKLIEVMDGYTTMLPNQKAGHEMRYSIAEIYFNYGHYDVATKKFEEITRDLPQTKQGDASARVLVAFQMEKKNWAEAVRLSKAFLDNKRLKTKSLTTHLVGVLRKAMFANASELEKLKKYDQAGQAFLAYQKEFSWDKKSADIALHNASVNFYKAGLLEDALAVNTKVIEKYPNSKLVPQAIMNIATTNEALANFDRAASYYKRYALSFPKDEKSPEALFQAANLYKGLKNYRESEKLYGAFVAKYPRSDLKVDAYFEMAKLQEKQGRAKDAIRTYNLAASSSKDADQRYFADAKAATLTERFIGRSSGKRLIDALVSKLSRKGAPNAYEARRLIAEAKFNGLNSRYVDYKNISLKSSRTIEADVKKKQARLASLANSYEGVIAIGSPEFSVASLYRLGEMHENFSEALFGVPAPSGASQVEVSKFRSSIEKVAFPLKEDAYKFYETAFKRSAEVETFTVWTKVTYDKMHDLAPERHPEVVEQSAEPWYMVHRVSLEPAVASLAH